MRLKVLPYVTVEVDDRVRRRVRAGAERLRVNMRAYLLSAADDVDSAGERMRGRVAAAVGRVDDAVGRVADRIAGENASSESDPDARLEAS
jgi:hypothetical protein